MATFRGTGWFNLPESPDRRRHGTLSFDGSNTVLLMTDSLVEYFSPTGQALPFQGKRDGAHPVVHGRLENGELVTLLRLTGSVRFRAGAFESWRCDAALLGGHADADAFVRISVQFDCLRAWAEPPPVVSDVLTDHPDLDTSRHVLERVTIDDSEVSLYAFTNGKWGGHSVHLERRCSLSVKMPPIPFSLTVEDWALSLNELLTVLLGRAVRFTRLAVSAESGFEAHDLRALHHLVTAESEDTVSVEELVSWGQPTTYLRESLPITFEQLIRRWMQARRDLPTVISLLCAPYQTESIYLEHRFNTVFQSAEGVARKLGARDKPAEVHDQRVAAVLQAAEAAEVDSAVLEWASKRLRSGNYKPLASQVRDLLAELGPIGEDIANSTSESFGSTVSKLRGRLSHPAAGDVDAATLYWTTEALVWAVRAYLLSVLGVSMEDLRDVIEKRGHYTQTVEAIRSEV